MSQKKTKGRPWRSWFPLLVFAIVSIGMYLKNWKQLDLVTQSVAEFTVSNQQGEEEKVMGGNQNRTSAEHGKELLVPQHVDGGAFVHLGKTGGSTLSQFLRNACHSFLPKPCGVIPNETLISRLITDYYHVPDFFRLSRKIHSFYLVSLRDPFERTVSGFVYGHPSNAPLLGIGMMDSWKRRRKGYFPPTCFETLEEWVQNLNTDDKFDEFDYPYLPVHMVQTNCTNFARAMLGARIKRMTHLFFNYQKIQSMMPHNATTTTADTTSANHTTTTTAATSPWDHLTVYVTRNEHLLDDFASINQLLLGDENSTTFDPSVLRAEQHVRNVSNLTLPVTRELSDKGRRRLCRALQPEYRLYITLLRHAKNLRNEDVQEALAYSQSKCPDLNWNLLSLQ
ncbi:expressed unknown protein [Seminavis robusta]|uniref:Sulfotransferase n=1 Tax=Seminavis robusta TaxID=568900 RepID=A0A9N8EJJ4_9STRA|nr:expressed unknown protein [Seminavis robusta]|eukprot:Sro1088_g239940.1 n/a (395) ;mRNA; f:7072-8370